MATDKSAVHIKLTPEQREMVRKATGRNAEAIELTAQASVPGMDAAKFQSIAEETKKACPVSKALAAVPRIGLKATLA